ncbi:MAG TPA: carbohydrate ABC transporter permease [Chloroflexota bacterium]|jgi:sn-glycerol 3-phosphate transport system permease protein|nr:carbohydrate ABC transporter permease [Chloroflexota bacterium]HZU77512.1 carbohydrate ABC transporter permease [Dehalococcoidia bacterium]
MRSTAVSKALGYLALLLMGVVIGLPLYWMLSGALKTTQQIVTFPPVWFPPSPRWQNFADAWTSAPFGNFYVNSIVTTAAASLAKLVNAVLCAYALAFLRFPGRDLVFLVILAALMIPVQVTILPNYLTMADLGWVNTYQGIVVPEAGIAFGAFLLRQHFMTLPREVLDAAKVDGAGHLRTMWSVALPLSRPILATLTLLTAVGRWNDFLWPLIITSTKEMRTLPIGIAWMFDTEGNTQWGVVMAGVVMVIVPVFVLFLWTQKHLVEGIAAGAVKG